MRMHIAVALSPPPVWISLYLLEHADPWAAALRLNICWLLWSCVVYYTPSFLSSSFCTNAVQVLQLESLLFLLHGFQQLPCLVACSFGWWVFSVAVFVPSWFPGQFGKT